MVVSMFNWEIIIVIKLVHLVSIYLHNRVVISNENRRQ